jgi:orotate phosphoribosyltransferase
MKHNDKKVAEKLLKIRAVKLQPAMPFTWASGWKSPIYCDNRKTLSYPTIRTYIKNEFCKIIKEAHPDVEVIAGVATGAIAQGALVAEELGLPFVYVRSAPKDHGLENLIEGDLKPKQKVVVIEDLISTGGSSLKAVEAIRNNGCPVLGMVAIFTYEFPLAVEEFKKNKVEVTTLCDYSTILDVALETDYISQKEIKTLQEWRKNPSKWDVE